MDTIQSCSRNFPKHRRGEPGTKWGLFPEWSLTWSGTRCLLVPPFSWFRPRRSSSHYSIQNHFAIILTLGLFFLLTFILLILKVWHCHPENSAIGYRTAIFCRRLVSVPLWTVLPCFELVLCCSMIIQSSNWPNFRNTSFTGRLSEYSCDTSFIDFFSQQLHNFQLPEFTFHIRFVHLQSLWKTAWFTILFRVSCLKYSLNCHVRSLKFGSKLGSKARTSTLSVKDTTLQFRQRGFVTWFSTVHKAVFI